MKCHANIEEVHTKIIKKELWEKEPGAIPACTDCHPPHKVNVQNIVNKIETTGNRRILLTERGVSFGYNNLVSDMRSLAVMRGTGCPVVFDATHSVQLPGGKGSASGGQREFVPVLSRAAIAVGVAGLFTETG